MKKLTAMMLAAALALSLTACGGKKDYSTDFTGKLNIPTFDLTVEDVYTLELLLAMAEESEGELDFEAHSFDEYRTVTEGYSLEDLQLLLEYSGVESEVSELDDRTVVKFDNGHVYGILKEDGKLLFVKWMLSDDAPKFVAEVWETVIEEGIKNWTESYGEPEVDKDERFYTWYGNVGGENASLSIEKGNGVNIFSMMELDRVQ